MKISVLNFQIFNWTQPKNFKVQHKILIVNTWYSLYEGLTLICNQIINCKQDEFI
jgi:hypothetical protein